MFVRCGIKGSKWRAGYKCALGEKCIIKEGHNRTGAPEGVCDGKVPCAVSTGSLCIRACVCRDDGSSGNGSRDEQKPDLMQARGRNGLVRHIIVRERERHSGSSFSDRHTHTCIQ